MSGNGGGGRDSRQRGPYTYLLQADALHTALLSRCKPFPAMGSWRWMCWRVDFPPAKGKTQTRTPNGIMVECCVAASSGKLRNVTGFCHDDVLSSSVQLADGKQFLVLGNR